MEIYEIAGKIFFTGNSRSIFHAEYINYYNMFIFLDIFSWYFIIVLQIIADFVSRKIKKIFLLLRNNNSLLHDSLSSIEISLCFISESKNYNSYSKGSERFKQKNF